MTFGTTLVFTMYGISVAFYEIENWFVAAAAPHGPETRSLVTSDCPQIFEDYKLKNTVWLTFLDSGKSLQEFVGETNIRFDVQFLVAQPADTAVRLFEVYRVTSDTPLRIRLFGAFGQPHSIPRWKYVYYRRRSFEGHVMKTASLNVSGTVWTLCVFMYSVTPLIRKLIIRIPNNPDWLGPLRKFVEYSTKLTCLKISGYPIKYSTVLWLLELQIRRGRKV